MACLGEEGGEMLSWLKSYILHYGPHWLLQKENAPTDTPGYCLQSLSTSPSAAQTGGT